MWIYLEKNLEVRAAFVAILTSEKYQDSIFAEIHLRFPKYFQWDIWNSQDIFSVRYLIFPKYFLSMVSDIPQIYSKGRYLLFLKYFLIKIFDISPVTSSELFQACFTLDFPNICTDESDKRTLKVILALDNLSNSISSLDKISSLNWKQNCGHIFWQFHSIPFKELGFDRKEWSEYISLNYTLFFSHLCYYICLHIIPSNHSGLLTLHLNDICVYMHCLITCMDF